MSETTSKKKPLDSNANPFEIPPPPTEENTGTWSLSTQVINNEQTTTLAPNYYDGYVLVPYYPIPQQNAVLVWPSYYHDGVGYILPGVTGPAYEASIPQVQTSISTQHPIYENYFYESAMDPSLGKEEEIYGTMEKKAEMGSEVQKEWRIRRRKNYHVGDVPFPTTLEESESSGTTTLMIRHIPYNIKLKELVELLDEHCCEQNKSIEDHADWSMFDVVYVPMDLRKHAKRGRMSNLGYAFVNFTTPKAAFKFYHQYHGNALLLHPQHHHNKCSINAARIQGKEAVVDEFSRKVYRCKTRDFLPVVFSEARNGFNRESEGTQLGRLVVVEDIPTTPLPLTGASHPSTTTTNDEPTSSSSSSLQVVERIASLSVVSQVPSPTTD